MNRRLLLAAALAAAVGCAENRTTIEIRGHAFPSSTDNGCAFAAGSDLQLGNGRLDIAYTGLGGYGPIGQPTYSAAIYIANTGTDPTVSDTTPGTTPSAASWRGVAARIRVNPSDYTDRYPPGPSLVPLGGSIRLPLPGQTIRPGSESVEVVELIDPTLAAALVAATPVGQLFRIVVGVTLEGETLGGKRVDSGEWFYGIDVCRGCSPLVCSDPAKTLSSCFGGWQDPAFCTGGG